MWFRIYTDIKMGKCPQPVTVTDSNPTTTDSVRNGYSFRVMPVDDKPKPEVVPITTKKPIKL